VHISSRPESARVAAAVEDLAASVGDRLLRRLGTRQEPHLGAMPVPPLLSPQQVVWSPDRQPDRVDSASRVQGTKVEFSHRLDARSHLFNVRAPAEPEARVRRST